jgi:ribosomal protein L32
MKSVFFAASNLNTCEPQKRSEKQMSSKSKCPRCGTPLTLKGGRKSEAKAKAKLLFAMHAERIFVCPKCGYQHRSHTIIMK